MDTTGMTYAQARHRNGNLPVLVAMAFADNRAVVWCHGCKGRHTHSLEPGDRGPHCGSFVKPAFRDGYYVVAPRALVKTLPRAAQAVWRGWTLEDVERVERRYRTRALVRAIDAAPPTEP